MGAAGSIVIVSASGKNYLFNHEFQRLLRFTIHIGHAEYDVESLGSQNTVTPKCLGHI